MIPNLLVDEIRTALRQRKLVPLVGAGISFDAPASLPIARELNEPIHDLLKADLFRIHTEAGLSNDEFKLCDNLIIEAPLESLLDALQTTYREKALNYLLSALVCDKFNVNHYGLALLAKSYGLSHIITLNFDILIELALDQLRITYETLCPIGRSSSQMSSSKCQCEIIKPHGTLAHSTERYSFENNLSTTLRVLGQEPNPSTVKKLEEIFKERPILLVAGYGAADWDIFPILQAAIGKGVLQRVYWIEHPGAERNKKLLKWFEELSRNNKGVRVTHDFTNLLAKLLENLDDKKPPRLRQSIDAKRMFDDQAKNIFAVVELLGIAGYPNIAILLLNWLQTKTLKDNDIPWDYLIARKLGFMSHLAGDSEKYFDSYSLAIQMAESLPTQWQATAVETRAWYVHSCLSLIKPQRISHTRNPIKWFKLYRKAKKALKECIILTQDNCDYERELGLANHFFADFWLAWMNLFFLFGPLVRGPLKIPSRLILQRVRKSRGYSDEFLSSGYWGLRNLELRLLAGELPQSSEDPIVLNEKERLETRESFYSLTKSQVEQGNAHAYMALLLGWIGEEQAKIEEQFGLAESIWSEQIPPCVQGLARVALFKRFLGYTSFRETIHYLRTELHNM